MSSEWGELSSEYGASCLLDVGRVVLGRVVLGRVVFGASCPDPPGTQYTSERKSITWSACGNGQKEKNEGKQDADCLVMGES